MEAYDVLGNPEKKSLYDRLNRELSRNEKVVANLKKLTNKLLVRYAGTAARGGRSS
jgi:curved DNA-binding protein CbpA